MRISCRFVKAPGDKKTSSDEGLANVRAVRILVGDDDL